MAKNKTEPDGSGKPLDDLKKEVSQYKEFLQELIFKDSEEMVAVEISVLQGSEELNEVDKKSLSDIKKELNSFVSQKEILIKKIDALRKNFKDQSYYKEKVIEQWFLQYDQIANRSLEPNVLKSLPSLSAPLQRWFAVNEFYKKINNSNTTPNDIALQARRFLKDLLHYSPLPEELTHVQRIAKTLDSFFSTQIFSKIVNQFEPQSKWKTIKDHFEKAQLDVYTFSSSTFKDQVKEMSADMFNVLPEGKIAKGTVFTTEGGDRFKFDSDMYVIGKVGERKIYPIDHKLGKGQYGTVYKLKSPCVELKPTTDPLTSLSVIETPEQERVVKEVDLSQFLTQHISLQWPAWVLSFVASVVQQFEGKNLANEVTMGNRYLQAVAGDKHTHMETKNITIEGRSVVVMQMPFLAGKNLKEFLGYPWDSKYSDLKTVDAIIADASLTRLHIMSKLPEGDDIKKYQGRYIYCNGPENKKLFYIKSGGVSEEVSITNSNLFEENLNSLNANKNTPCRLDREQFKALITENGGHERQVKTPMSMTERLEIAESLIQQAKLMEDAKMVHGDLFMDNIQVLDAKDPEGKTQVRLMDFTFARHIDDVTDNKEGLHKCWDAFNPPEIQADGAMAGKEKDNPKVDASKAQMYALGKNLQLIFGMIDKDVNAVNKKQEPSAEETAKIKVAALISKMIEPKIGSRESSLTNVITEINEIHKEMKGLEPEAQAVSVKM